jgi:hypothetical protein
MFTVAFFLPHLALLQNLNLAMMAEAIPANVDIFHDL